MPDYQQLLIKFNISPTATKVYLALLEIGKASADKIAKKAGTYKANVYDALERLEENGLVSHTIEENKKLYLPTNPEKLISTAEEIKRKTLENYEDLKKDLEKVMPELLLKYKSIKEKELFEIYRGKKAYRAMINEIIKERPKFWKGFGNLQVQEYFPYDFVRWFQKVKFMLFATQSDQVLKRLKEAKKITKVEIKWLPKEIYMPIVWTIFGSNLLILVYEPDIVALRIKSAQIVKTFTHQFEYLWKKHR